MASNDTTTPDPLFNNDPDGSDPGGGSVSNASAASSKRPSSTMENNGGAVSSPSVSKSKVKKKNKKATDFFPDKAHVTDALRTVLANLDATDLTLVYEKQHMPPSDRNKGQNRLLMSCKCEIKRASFASIFTDTEMPLVHLPTTEPLKTTTDQDERKHGSNKDNGKHNAIDDVDQDDDEQQGTTKQRSTVAQGLAVQAYDCEGRAYELNIKYLSSNTGYRIIGSGYKVFLENNGLLVGGATPKRSAGKKRRSSSPDDEQLPALPAVRHAGDDIQMELWAFRSPKLSIGAKDQPGGALGLLLLHHRGGGEAEAEAEAGTEEEEVQVVHEQPRQQNNSYGMATQQDENMLVGSAAHDEEVIVGDAAIADEDDAAAGDAAPRSNPTPTPTRDMPLGPLESLIAGWLSFLGHHGHGRTDVTRATKGPN